MRGHKMKLFGKLIPASAEIGNYKIKQKWGGRIDNEYT